MTGKLKFNFYPKPLMGAVAAGFLLHKSLFSYAGLDIVILWCLFLTWLVCELAAYIDSSKQDPVRSINKVYDLVPYVKLGIEEGSKGCTDPFRIINLIEVELDKRNKEHDAIQNSGPYGG